MLNTGSRALLAAVLALFTPSCRKPPASKQPPANAPVIAADLTVNRMKEAPQGLLSSRAAIPGPLAALGTRRSTQANDAHRLVFAFIGSAQYPGCVEALDAIDRDPELTARLNRRVRPGAGGRRSLPRKRLAAGWLSQKSTAGVLSLHSGALAGRQRSHLATDRLRAGRRFARDLFEGAADVISRMWAESPDYVNRNSVGRPRQPPGRFPQPDPGSCQPGGKRCAAQPRGTPVGQHV
jgi:hypothetical protein